MGDVKKGTEKSGTATTPCLCAALRQAARAVTKSYDTELRRVGLRSTQHALLRLLGRTGEIRQSDLGELAALDETTVTRSLCLLKQNGWVAIRVGSDRREKKVTITASGKDKLKQADPAWSKAQERMRLALPDGAWGSLLAALPEVTKAAIGEDALPEGA